MILSLFRKGHAEQSWEGNTCLTMMLLIHVSLTLSLEGGIATVVGLPKGFPKINVPALLSRLPEGSVMVALFAIIRKFFPRVLGQSVTKTALCLTSSSCLMNRVFLIYFFNCARIVLHTTHNVSIIYGANAIL